MYAIATFLVVAVMTLVFTKTATGALIATGTPPRIASFQARSAFTGAGFTTTEAENVVNHPVRRRIISVAMFVGTLGTPTLVVTVVLGLVAPGPGTTTERTLAAVAGLVLILLLVLNRPMTRWLERVGRDYAQARLLPVVESSGQELLVLDDGFVVATAVLSDEPVDAPRSLRGLDHTFPGITILGVRRSRQFFGEGPSDIALRTGDELVVFGSRDRLMGHGLLDQED